MLVEMERQSGLALTLESASASTQKTRCKRKLDESQQVAGSSAAAADGETESSRERLLAKLSNKCALLKRTVICFLGSFTFFTVQVASCEGRAGVRRLTVQPQSGPISSSV